MKILYLTYFFYPEIGAASIRASDIVKILVDLGNEVDVIAPIPSYPYGKVYKGYFDDHFGANVDRIQCKIAANSDSMFKRLKAQFDFFSKVRKMKITDKYDFIISSTPPLFVSWLGDILSKRLKVPHIVDIRDLWPESVVDTGIISRYHPLAIYANHLSKRIVKNADLIISPVRGILKRFNFKKTLWIPNVLKPLQEPKVNDNPKLRCIYAGTIGHMQYVELLNDLKKGDSFEVVVVGTGKDVDKLEDVNYLGSMSREDTIEEINKSDIGFVLMKYSKTFFKDALPSKIFEYIAYGKPIISNLLGETAEFLKENRCGITVDSTPKAIKAAIEFLSENRDFYKKLSNNALLTSKKYSKEFGVKKMLDFISKENNG